MRRDEKATSLSSVTPRPVFSRSLDGYRGSLVVLALVARCQRNNNSLIVNTLHQLDYSYSTCGFLLLASFLLTHRLLLDLLRPLRPSQHIDTTTNNNDSINRKFSISTIGHQTWLIALFNFLTRRLLRIYLVYLAFYALVIAYSMRSLQIIEPPFEFEPDLVKVARLAYPGSNHFWPVTCALKYAFYVIPVYCLLVRILANSCRTMTLFQWLLLAAAIVFILLTHSQRNNQPVGLDDLDVYSPSIVDLSSDSGHLNVLLAGTCVAHAFILIQRSGHMMRAIQTDCRIGRLLNLLSISAVVCGLERTASSSSGLFWSLSLFATLLLNKSKNDKNQTRSTLLRRLFDSSRWLNKIGQCSLSFYFIHVPVVCSLRFFLFEIRDDLVFALLALLVNFIFSLMFFYLFENVYIRMVDRFLVTRFRCLES